MSKAKKSDGRVQVAMLDVVKRDLARDIVDLILVNSNLKQCDKAALQEIQTEYKGHFGEISTAVEAYVGVRAAQGGKTAPEAPVPEPSPEVPVPEPLPTFVEILANEHGECGPSPETSI